MLRELLDEGISIRDLRGMLESLLSINGTTDVDFGRFIVFAPRTENLCLADSSRGLDGLSPADYSNFVRTTLKKYISHKFTKGGATLIVYLLDPEKERRIRNTVALPLTDDEKTRLMEAIIDTPTARSGRILASPRTARRSRSYTRSTSV